MKPLLIESLPGRNRAEGGRLVWRLLAFLAAWMRAKGLQVLRIAKILGTSVRTCWRLLKGEQGRPGRPRKEIPSALWAQIEVMLAEWGGKVSVDYLKYKFPSAGRRAIRELKREWIKRAKAAKRARQDRLTWQQPGRVWSLDGAFAPGDMEGQGRRFLVARDLASRYTLGVVVAGETSRESIRFLKSLFARHGRPLVLKSDNGPGFKAKSTQRFLRGVGVAPLLSTPYYPEYNGAIERGMQDIKGFAEATATLAERPGNWLQEDLRKAMTLANTREVKREGQWLSPQQDHAGREPISSQERGSFLKQCEKAIQQEKAAIDLELAACKTTKERKRLLAKATRLGVSQALTQGGYLTVEEGRLSQPLSGVERAMIIDG